jgi:hypothetical protein
LFKHAGAEDVSDAEDLTAFFDDGRIKRQPLPGVLGMIEQAAGYLAAERFAAAFGGQNVYLPLALDQAHPVARAAGLNADEAAAVGAAVGRSGPLSGGAWPVPIAQIELKWNVSRRLRLQGKSNNEIVRILRETYRLPTTAARVGELCRDLPALAKAGRPPVNGCGEAGARNGQ